jgi:2-dehydropantoate 2-reductase
MSRVAVWGAGAIGGVIGAWMARAGVDVTLVDQDAAHVREVAARGLLIDGVREAFRVQVPCVTPDAAQGPFDLVFLAVKCMHTGAALDGLVPHLAPDGAVVSVQNGLNEEVIARRVGAERTIGCFVNFGADWQAPGHVQHGGEHPIYVGELDGGTTDRIARVRELLGHFCETIVTDNIHGYLWSKMALAAVLFATATVDEPVYEIAGRPECGETLFLLGKEALTVPRAKGIRLERLVDFWPEEYEGDDWRRAMTRMGGHFEGQIKVKTGIWRDLAVRKRRTEVDCQVGELIRHGEAEGLQLPMCHRLLALVHDLEDRRRAMAWENIALLRT